MAKKVDRREVILRAMLDLVVERGFHNAPMSLLAKKSGASPGVIYHYFPSKDDVIHALYKHVDAIKREEMLKGYQKKMAPKEALQLVWTNAYWFYRKYRKEMRFLDQYLNSPYCEGGKAEGSKDDTVERIQKLTRPKKKGGVMKDLPPEAIQSLTLGLAADLAKAPKEFSKGTLREIADVVWAAVAEE